MPWLLEKAGQWHHEEWVLYAPGAHHHTTELPATLAAGNIGVFTPSRSSLALVSGSFWGRPTSYANGVGHSGMFWGEPGEAVSTHGERDEGVYTHFRR